MHKEETLAGNRNHIDFFLGQFLFIQRALPNTDTDPVLLDRISHSEWVTFHSNPEFFNHPGKFPVWNAAVIFLSLLYSYFRVLGPLLFPLVLHLFHFLHNT